jgi:hypothetical protein
MKMGKVFSLAGFVLTGIMVWTGSAQAQFFGWGTDQREAAQQQRIHQGVHSGALTPQEARQLTGEQRRIQAAENRMLADGRLDYRERGHLDRMQDRADRHIYRQAHDNQGAYPGYRQHRERQRGPHYAPRNHHPQPRAYCGLNNGDRGRVFQRHHRDRRLSWHR